MVACSQVSRRQRRKELEAGGRAKLLVAATGYAKGNLDEKKPEPAKGPGPVRPNIADTMTQHSTPTGPGKDDPTFREVQLLVGEKEDFKESRKSGKPKPSAIRTTGNCTL